MENAVVSEEKIVKKENKFKRFLKAVFVHNFWGKVAAIVISAALWVLAVGLSKPADSKTGNNDAADTTAVVRTADAL